MILTVSGIRDLDESSYWIVYDSLRQWLGRVKVTEFRCGGARGTDVVALRFMAELSKAKRVVFVPFQLDDQPLYAVETIRSCADYVVEMKLLKSKIVQAFHARNLRMLQGQPDPGAGYGLTDILLAFTAGHDTGGTGYTLKSAQSLGVETIERYHVQRFGSIREEL